MMVALFCPGGPRRRVASEAKITWCVVVGMTTMSSWLLPNPPTDGRLAITPMTVCSMAPIRTFLPIGSMPALAKSAW